MVQKHFEKERLSNPPENMRMFAEGFENADKTHVCVERQDWICIHSEFKTHSTVCMGRPGLRHQELWLLLKDLVGPCVLHHYDRLPADRGTMGVLPTWVPSRATGQKAVLQFATSESIRGCKEPKGSHLTI